jgi:hypothetical protein
MVTGGSVGERALASASAACWNGASSCPTPSSTAFGPGAGGGRREKARAVRASRRQFRVAGHTGVALSFSTATLLRDGHVLVAGGYNDRLAVTSRAWIVSPP